MKRPPLKIFVTLLSLAGWMTSGAIFAASGARNGADNFADESGAAWFVGGRPVRFCVEAAADFGLSNQEVVDDINFAFDRWRTYLHAHEDTVNRDAEGRSLPPLVFNSTFVSRCDGSEDLTFFLGVENDLVHNYMLPMDKPVAFAQRLSYDPERMWGKGFIWVASTGAIDPTYQVDGWRGFPDWRDNNTLRMTLTHELGHVLGTGHVDLTIMQPGFAWALKVWSRIPSDATASVLPDFLRIDQERFLVPPSGSQPSYTEAIPATSLQRESLTMLLGRTVRGKMSITFTLTGIGSGQLVLTDEGGTTRCHVAYTSISLDNVDLRFRRAWVPTTGPERGKLQDGGYVAVPLLALGRITVDDGRSYPVLLRDAVTMDIDLITDLLSPQVILRGEADPNQRQ